MQDPRNEIRDVVRSLCELPRGIDLVNSVEKYFTPDAQIVYPLFNSPKASGIEGVKAAYQMLRTLTYGQHVEFHAVAFDRIETDKGIERLKGFLDFTEHLKIRILPDRVNPWFHFRFITRIDLVRNPNDNKWYVEKQEDNLPSDFGSTGLHFLPFDVQISNAIKWVTGVGTLVAGYTFSRLGIF
ncbi:hypothetical protein JCM11251_005156 [Rhodosporidiobolus azoricus]